MILFDIISPQLTQIKYAEILAVVIIVEQVVSRLQLPGGNMPL